MDFVPIFAQKASSQPGPAPATTAPPAPLPSVEGSKKTKKRSRARESIGDDGKATKALRRLEIDASPAASPSETMDMDVGASSGPYWIADSESPEPRIRKETPRGILHATREDARERRELSARLGIPISRDPTPSFRSVSVSSMLTDPTSGPPVEFTAGPNPASGHPASRPASVAPGPSDAPAQGQIGPRVSSDDKKILVANQRTIWVGIDRSWSLRDRDFWVAVQAWVAGIYFT